MGEMVTEIDTETEPAALIHRLPGRLRLRFAQLKGAPDELQTLQTLMTAIPGVRTVETNARLGSLLVLHDCEEDTLFRSMRRLAGISVEPPSPSDTVAPDPPMSFLDGFLSYRQVLGGGLLIMGVVQLLRGNIATPATTAFWYALTLLSQSPDQPIAPPGPDE